MTDINTIRDEITARIEEIAPIVREYEELVRARQALDPTNLDVLSSARFGRPAERAPAASAGRSPDKLSPRQRQLYEALSRHPKGIRMVDLAKEMGENGATVLYPLGKVLLASGLAKKVNSLWVPVSEAEAIAARAEEDPAPASPAAAGRAPAAKAKRAAQAVPA